MNLAMFLTAATTGDLTFSEGRRTRVGLDAAARLYAAVTDDLDAGHLGLLEIFDARLLPIDLDGPPREQGEVRTLRLDAWEDELAQISGHLTRSERATLRRLRSAPPPRP